MGRLLLVLCAVGLLAGCAVVRTETPLRIALLAPFEGRYREIGYAALYPARLAADDAGPGVELLAVDDGGTVESAVNRARALALDSRVKAVVTLGYDATAPETQQAYGGLPVLVVGYWASEPRRETIFMLTNAALPDRLSATERLDVTEAARVETPFVGGDVFALEGFRELRQHHGLPFEGITVYSSGLLPNDDFRQRVLESDPFAVEPGLLATTTYDAVRLAAAAIGVSDGSRAAVGPVLHQIEYAGLTGTIVFEKVDAGYYRANAPLNAYSYNLHEPSRPLHTSEGP